MLITPDTYQSSTIADLRRVVRRIAEAAPELAARAEAAGAIVLAGKVAQHPEHFEVLGGGERAYTVGADARSCTCPDFTHRGVEFKGRKFCKHTLAVLVLCRLSAPRPASRSERIATFRARRARHLSRKAA